MILLTRKKVRLIITTVCAIAVVGFASPFGVVATKSAIIKDDLSNVYQNDKYMRKVQAEGVSNAETNSTSEDVVVEMLSSWKEKRSAQVDKIKNESETSSTIEFARKVEKALDMDVETITYLKNTELVDNIYSNLEKGNPVAFAWAYESNEEWRTNYSIVTSLDVSTNKVNVYEYEVGFKDITLEEFISRTSFSICDDKMPITMQLGFAFGTYSKNTIFVLSE